MIWKVLTLTWVVFITVILSNMHSWHNFAFETPSKEEMIRLGKQKSWNMLHFMAEGCSCSHHLIDYLVERGRTEGWSEEVIIIGEIKGAKKKLEEKGFKVVNFSFEEARKNESLYAVPLLVIFDGDKKISYMGGYTQAAITPLSSFYDVKLARSIASNEKIDHYPVKGCATSKKYQKLLDPFGLKYRSEENERI
jgi:hypothetical protein